MARYYGGDGTIHSTDHLDVETDNIGNVVAVWFRCQPLPFKQVREDWDRAFEMNKMYEEGKIPSLVGIEVEDG